MSTLAILLFEKTIVRTEDGSIPLEMKEVLAGLPGCLRYSTYVLTMLPAREAQERLLALGRDSNVSPEWNCLGWLVQRVRSCAQRSLLGEVNYLAQQHESSDIRVVSGSADLGLLIGVKQNGWHVGLFEATTSFEFRAWRASGLLSGCRLLTRADEIAGFFTT